MRSYELYEPLISQGTVYSGTFGRGEFPYNHMVSIEWFAGKYYAVWSANARTNREGQPGQINVVSLSDDFISWTHPADIAGPELSEEPVIEPDEVFWQPELLSLPCGELWCMWSFGKERATLPGKPGWGDPEKGRGLWLSRLSDEPGSKWRHQKIMDLVEADGRHCAPFVSQNPFLCSTGRIIAPLTLVHDPREPDGEGSLDPVRMYNVCAWTDDSGETWNISNPISRVDEPFGQWEPHFWEQADGSIRGIMRNFDLPENRKKPQPPAERQLTVEGGSSKKGTEIVFDREPTYARIETGRTRSQVFRCSGGERWCMLGGDAYTPTGARLQCSVYFSRTGTMDFVAGPRYSPRHVYATYSQGIAHNGRLLAAYTVTENRHQVWRILTSVLDPAPEPGVFYIWPREQHIENSDRSYTEPVKLREFDGRSALHFRMRSSAGVEIDPVDFASGQCLKVRMCVKVLKLQHRGNLVFCSFGDRIPIRIGMPGNRPGLLYAYGYSEWQEAGDLPVDEWTDIELTIGPASFSVSIDDKRTEFRSPIIHPNPRLYLGSGYETDEHPANSGSEFLIDIDSFKTEAVQ